MAEEAAEKKSQRQERPSGDEEKKPEEKSAGPSPLVKKLIIVGVIVAVIVVEVIVAYMLVKATKQEDPRLLAEKQVKEQEAKERVKKTTMGATTAPIEVIVNIAGEGQAERFAKVSIQLEYEEAEGAKEEGGGHGEGEKGPTGFAGLITMRIPKIKNLLIEELTKRKLDELVSPSGKVKFRQDIKREINNMIPKEKGSVTEVYLSEFVIQ